MVEFQLQNNDRTIMAMRLIGRERLLEFGRKHQDARTWIGAWVAEVGAASWKTPHDVKNRYPSASLLGSNQVIFNVCGNKYRMECVIAYETSTVAVLWLGTHAEYTKRFS